jgi:hypothetical protein
MTYGFKTISLGIHQTAPVLRWTLASGGPAGSFYASNAVARRWQIPRASSRFAWIDSPAQAQTVPARGEVVSAQPGVKEKRIGICHPKGDPW